MITRRDFPCGTAVMTLARGILEAANIASRETGESVTSHSVQLTGQVFDKIEIELIKLHEEQSKRKWG